jgi:proteasome lid subunit RPN8/RPN11
MLITCEGAHLVTTLDHLRDGGRDNCECVVLWLGRREGASVIVQEVYRPKQIAKADMFWIPPEGMDALKLLMRRRRLMVAAQVHSHPGGAFHSAADDQWAIVRHEGALSIVVPEFALHTFRENFFDHAKAYQLSPANEWCEVGRDEVSKWLQIY